MFRPQRSAKETGRVRERAQFLGAPSFSKIFVLGLTFDGILPRGKVFTWHNTNTTTISYSDLNAGTVLGSSTVRNRYVGLLFVRENRLSGRV